MPVKNKVSIKTKNKKIKEEEKSPLEEVEREEESSDVPAVPKKQISRSLDIEEENEIDLEGTDTKPHDPLSLDEDELEEDMNTLSEEDLDPFDDKWEK